MPIDPYFAARFRMLDGLESMAELLADPAKMSQFEAAMTPPVGYVPPVCVTDEVTAPGPHGPIPLRIYSPDDASGVSPGLVWAHGGGWQAGDLDMPESDMVARELCRQAGAVVVSVDYRLAVDGVTFPVPLDDVVAAWRWVANSAHLLGIGPGMLSLGGASAGGNLAASAALRIRDEGGVVPAGLLLAYPAVHHPLVPADPERASLLAELPRLLRLLPEEYDHLVENFLGSLTDVPAYAMAADMDLGGLPPTVIIASEYDDLRVSAEDFAGQLEVAGVPTHYRVEAGMPHGHLNFNPKIAGTDRSLRVLADFLAVRALEGVTP